MTHIVEMRIKVPFKFYVYDDDNSMSDKQIVGKALEELAEDGIGFMDICDDMEDLFEPDDVDMDSITITGEFDEEA